MEQVKVNGANTVAQSTYDNLVKTYMRKDREASALSREVYELRSFLRRSEQRVEELEAELHELRHCAPENEFDGIAATVGKLEQALLNRTEMTPCAIEDVLTQVLVNNL